MCLFLINQSNEFNKRCANGLSRGKIEQNGFKWCHFFAIDSNDSAFVSYDNVVWLQINGIVDGMKKKIAVCAIVITLYDQWCKWDNRISGFLATESHWTVANYQGLKLKQCHRHIGTHSLVSYIHSTAVPFSSKSKRTVIPKHFPSKYLYNAISLSLGLSICLSLCRVKCLATLQMFIIILCVCAPFSL